jgi:hypothetical protein
VVDTASATHLNHHRLHVVAEHTKVMSLQSLLNRILRAHETLRP